MGEGQRELKGDGCVHYLGGGGDAVGTDTCRISLNGALYTREA